MVAMNREKNAPVHKGTCRACKCGGVHSCPLTSSGCTVRRLTTHCPFVSTAGMNVCNRSNNKFVSTTTVYACPSFCSTTISSTNGRSGHVCGGNFIRVRCNMSRGIAAAGSDLKMRDGACSCDMHIHPGRRLTGGCGRKLLLFANTVSRAIGPTGALHLMSTLVGTSGSFSVFILPGYARKFFNRSRDFFRRGV